MNNLHQILLFGDVLAKPALLLVGIAARTTVLRFLLRRHTAVFGLLALGTMVVACLILGWYEMGGVFDPEKGTRPIGWHEMHKVLDRMDYDALVFAGYYYDPERWYYFNSLNLNWHPKIKRVPMEKYEP